MFKLGCILSLFGSLSSHVLVRTNENSKEKSNEQQQQNSFFIVN